MGVTLGASPQAVGATLGASPFAGVALGPDMFIAPRR
jgi:hypothetical protein